MYNTYKGKVEFFLVYIREAHPTDGWQVGSNEREKILVKQPKTFDERLNVAKTMCSKLDIKLPTLIDGIDNKVGDAYAGMPDRLYLVGVDGKVAYQGDKGPRGFKPEELEKAIKKMLAAKGDGKGEKKE